MMLAMSSRTGLPEAASGGARRWHLYEEVEGDPTLREELRDVLTATRDGSPVPRHELEMRLAEFKNQVNYAEHGRLSAAGWEYVNRDPRLWEFRLLWGDQDIKVRAYTFTSHGNARTKRWCCSSTSRTRRFPRQRPLPRRRTPSWRGHGVGSRPGKAMTGGWAGPGRSWETDDPA